jgi:hypothetical protein
MFETEVHPIRSSILGPLARYTAQLLVLYPLTLIAGIPLFFLLPKCGIDGNLGYGVNFAGFDALICVYMALLVGWVSGRQIPSLVRTGLWIWLLPTAVALYDIAPALLQSQAAPRLTEYVYATGSNEGLGVFLVTLPVSSTIGYSVGMLLARRESACSTADVMGVRIRVLSCWAATFAVACAFMMGTEQRMVERDRKLRVAVRFDGTPLAPDAGVLCDTVGTGAVTTPVVLQSVTMLEFVEHAECPNGRPAYGIDRVRVLDGPNKALDGWVVTSQVWRPLPLP